jgi:hypothetical protein
MPTEELHFLAGTATTPTLSLDKLLELARTLEDQYTLTINGHKVSAFEYEERPELAPPGTRLAVRRTPYRNEPGIMAIMVWTEGEHKGKALIIPSFDWGKVELSTASPNFHTDLPMFKL